MPSMRVMALAEFFFPSSRYKKVRRSSRTRLPAVYISRNHGSNLYPCVWMSTSSRSPTARSHRPEHFCPQQHPSSAAGMDGAMSLGAEENQSPWSGSWFNGRSDSPDYVAEHGQYQAIPVALPGPARTPMRNQSIGHRNSSRRAAEQPNDHDSSRFSFYGNVMRQAQTCFIGTNPLTATDPDFYDQTICFRVIDQTSDHQRVVIAREEREMMVVSSPANMPSVLNTLAPPGSGRRVVIRARAPQGLVQQGDLQFLAHILSRGWPFDIVLEDE